MTTPVQQTEEEAVRAVVATVEAGQQDPNIFGDHLTDNAVLVNLFGFRTIGKKEFVDALPLRSEAASSHSWKNQDVTVVFVKPDVAIATSLKDIEYDGEPGPGMTPQGLATLVLSKVDGRWLIALAQTTGVPGEQ